MSDQRFLGLLQQGLQHQPLPEKTRQLCFLIDGDQDSATDQTELDAVEDPLDGEACQEDHAGEEHQADVEAACLDPSLTHATHPLLGCLVSDVTRE